MTDSIAKKVGELNPSQLLYTYGVGAIVDLPHISAIVGGLDEWPRDLNYTAEIIEPRLLYNVQRKLGINIKRLMSFPVTKSQGQQINPFEQPNYVGVPVYPFPEWLNCPACETIASTNSELFELKYDPFHPERTSYRHVNCLQAKKPNAVPVRFLVTCENGHLDDFPWLDFTHNWKKCPKDGNQLTLFESGLSGEARDLFVKCCACGQVAQLTRAFGKENRVHLPQCTARRPHLHDIDPEGCDLKMRPILLGATNLWFGSVLSTISIPDDDDTLRQLITQNWAELSKVESIEELRLMEKWHKLSAFAAYNLTQIWDGIQSKLTTEDETTYDSNLLKPEWEAFTNPESAPQTDQFRVRSVKPPAKFSKFIEKVVLAEKIREVRALIGFTRIDSVGESTDTVEDEIQNISPISRLPMDWVPGIEVHGEGIFIQFDEQAIHDWAGKPRLIEREAMFLQAHVNFKKSKGAEKPEAGYPGLKYLLLHSFSHALLHQIALESGYSMASIRERIYCDIPGSGGEPMAGVLLYTSASDSEGTLGGLVNLGSTESLERHIVQALEASRLCSSDPTCAEHLPSYGVQNISGAACHVCQFVPETSCEKGNRYLDRSLLVTTVNHDEFGFFDQ